MPSAINRAFDGANKGSIGGPYGAIGGFIDGLFNGPLYQTTVQDQVKFGHIKPDPLSKTYSDFFSQADQFPELAKFSDSLNSMLQSEISKTIPDLFPTLGELSKTTLSESKGLIPADVAAQTNRSTAFTNEGAGINNGEAFGNSAEARNLGLNSLQLKDKAFGQVGLLESLGKDLNPVNPINFIFTPQQLQSRSDQIKILNSGRDTQQQLVNAGIQQSNTNTAIQSAALLSSLFTASNKTSSNTNTTTNPAISDYFLNSAGSIDTEGAPGGG